MICRNSEHSQLQLKTTGATFKNTKYHPVLNQDVLKKFKTSLIRIINLSQTHGNSKISNP